MKAGDLVRYKRQDRAMVGMIVKIHVNKTPVVLWGDGQCGQCIPAFLEVISESR